MQKPSAYLFFGRSGSGKGTQAKLLQSYLSEHDSAHPALVVSTGKKFREFAQGDSYTSERVRGVLSDGGILPINLSVWMWTQWLLDNFSGSEHVIIDGLGRKAHEVPVLAEALEFYGLTPAYVFELDISDEEATERLLARQRDDDTPERIKRRLSWFDTDVRAALDALAADDRFVFNKVDGSKTAEEVHRDVVSMVELNK